MEALHGPRREAAQAAAHHPNATPSPYARSSLPKHLLSSVEVERVMNGCDITDPIGLRDRAILETVYSTGIRRLEVVRLKLYDLALDRGLLLVNQGKGSKDRYVPLGARAIACWL